MARGTVCLVCGACRRAKVWEGEGAFRRNFGHRTPLGILINSGNGTVMVVLAPAAAESGPSKQEASL